MLQTPRATRGMVTAPHHLASQAGLRVLQDGGNAVEAMIAVASTIAVVYPHMNGLGGDNFWLIHGPGRDVIGIDACGGAAGQADAAFYGTQGHKVIPSRGPLAALTVAGAVSGWGAAHKVARDLGGKLPLPALLEDAIHYAHHGVPVTDTQHLNTVGKMPELQASPGFLNTYAPGGIAPAVGSLFKNSALAETLQKIGREGTETFYRGKLSAAIAADLERVGSPLRLADLERHTALDVAPLSLEVAGHRVFNMPPPTQGLASLLLLGTYARLGIQEAETLEYVHGLIESTKQAFKVRDTKVTDPAYMATPATAYLDAAKLDAMAAAVDRETAEPWPPTDQGGDTVWMGVIDNDGNMVSMIQSLFWEFGSGCVLPETGIVWQNRGTSFSLQEGAVNELKPHRRPFHTIQPAMALLNDGRTMVYGTMGGEGQPQTQAMVFTRHVLHGQTLQQAVTAPRWLLGKTWGADNTSLRIENRFDASVIEGLKAAGHPVEVIGAFDEVMGHAGGIVRHPSGVLEGASDPRSDGVVAGF